MQKNEIIQAYVRYYHEHIAKIEEEPRMIAFGLLLIDVAEKIYGTETALSIGFQILSDRMETASKGERPESIT